MNSENPNRPENSSDENNESENNPPFISDSFSRLGSGPINNPSEPDHIASSDFVNDSTEQTFEGAANNFNTDQNNWQNNQSGFEKNFNQQGYPPQNAGLQQDSFNHDPNYNPYQSYGPPNYGQPAYSQGSFQQGSFQQGSFQQGNYQQGPFSQQPFSQQPFSQGPYQQGNYQQAPYGSPGYQQFQTTPYQNPHIKRKVVTELHPVKISGWLIIGLIAALVGALIGTSVSKSLITSNQQTIVKEFFPTQGAITKPGSITAILAKDLPAVVSIQATGSGISDAGTGMIITSNGDVLTNNHVVAAASIITVTLYGQTKLLPAKVLGTIPSKDMALLKILNQKNLPTVTFGNSSLVQQGDSVVAIGNALDLEGGPTVTSGIVSALNRQLSATNDVTGQPETLSGMIQTDAPINPGNSGGPLVLSNGDVIGMNTAVASSSAGNAPAQNVGFAIPINSIKPELSYLAKGGSSGAPSTSVPNSSNTPFMGVYVETFTQQLAQQLGENFVPGVLISSVIPGYPAASAGIQSYDVITQINNTAVSTTANLRTTINKYKPGDTVTLKIYRSGNYHTIQVTLTSTP